MKILIKHVFFTWKNICNTTIIKQIALIISAFIDLLKYWELGLVVENVSLHQKKRAASSTPTSQNQTRKEGRSARGARRGVLGEGIFSPGHAVLV